MSGSPHGVFGGTKAEVLIHPETCFAAALCLADCWACGFATTAAMTTATTTATPNNCLVIGAFSSEDARILHLLVLLPQRRRLSQVAPDRIARGGRRKDQQHFN